MGLLRVRGDRILSIPIDPAAHVPVYQQVYTGVRRAIVDGIVESGSRLPSTRSLAADLGVSRNTVVMAYERLRGEGYAVGRGGSDTRVSESVPDRVMRIGPSRQVPRKRGIARASATATRLERHWKETAPPLDSPPGAFRTGVPATDLFPYALWGRLLSRRWGAISARDLGYGNMQGYQPLRVAIARYLAAARGVMCTPEQVFIVGGAQAALSIAARLVIDPGDSAWVEDPGYPGARAALLAAGAKLVPVPVDGEGMRVGDASRMAPDARAAFITPSRQMPLGVTLSCDRRAALLAWAAEHKSWIIEDDYDSELRFASRPLPALQGEDPNGCVIYIGTFSKAIFPALRLGYLVVPPELVDATAAVRSQHDFLAPMLEQHVLTDFIEGGHFERHVRRVRQVYFERQQTLRDAVRRQLRGVLEIPPGEAGLVVTGYLSGISDAAAVQSAAAQGVDIIPLSRLSMGASPAGVVLGYAGLNETDIIEGVEKLARAWLPLVARR
jgi:GntR family transcriptional regulator/MocR family aminotransferase